MSLGAVLLQNCFYIEDGKPFTIVIRTHSGRSIFQRSSAVLRNAVNSSGHVVSRSGNGEPVGCTGRRRPCPSDCPLSPGEALLRSVHAEITETHEGDGDTARGVSVGHRKDSVVVKEKLQLCDVPVFRVLYFF